MDILKGIGYVFLALVLLGVILGIFAFLMIIKTIVAAVLFLAFLVYCIIGFFEARKANKPK